MIPVAPDGYRVLAELGRGGGGVVFRAREAATGREVALKLLLEPDRDPRRRERFRREAELAAGLTHPGVVRVHAVGEGPDSAWIVYELVQGGRTLEEVWREEDPRLRRRQRVEQVLEVARAVAHAHARGVVHRDLKPQNLLLDPQGRVRVTDFGLAAARGLSRLTRTGHAVGTPHYMAPEQAAGERGEPAPTIDVWALGVLLYEALTGQLPFVGADPAHVMMALHTRDPDPPRSLDPEIDPAMETLCLRALQRDPRQRPPDGEAFAVALSRALEGAPSRRGGRGRWLAAGAGAGLLAAALAVAGWTVLGAPPPQTADPEEGLAARRRVEEAWLAGDVPAARELLRAAGGVEVPCRPWVLALAGEAGEALRLLPERTGEAQRARLCAWAGEPTGCAEALARLASAEPGRARALAWELRGLLPGLPLAGSDEGQGPWPALARAEGLLAGGDAAGCAAELLPLRQAPPPDPELRHALSLLWARAALARGQLEELRPALREAWAARSDDPLRAAACVGWSALLAPLLPPGPPLEGLGPDSLAEAARRAPGEPHARAAAGGEQGPLDAARRALAEGDPARAGELLAAGGRAPRPGSFARAELELCRAGADGEAGLLLARAGDLALAALEGAERTAAAEALGRLDQVAPLRSTSPARLVLCVTAARAAHDLGRARACAEEALRAAPGDAWALLERARVGLALVEEMRLAADAHRVLERELRPEDVQAERPRLARAELERPAASALRGVAEAFQQARQAAPLGDPLEEEARLEGAAVWAERAHRLARAGSDPREVAAAREAALSELAPLLQRVPRAALLVAREALLTALTGPGSPEARLDSVRRAELELGQAARGVDPRAQAAAAVAAAAAPGPDAEAWARVYLTLAGDLPARAVLALRAVDVPTLAERQRAQDHALALLPELPLGLLLREGARLHADDPGPAPGVAPGSALTLGRAALASPVSLEHAAGLLSLTGEADLEACLAQLQADAAAPGADPAAEAAAGALLRLALADGRAVLAEAARSALLALRLRPGPAAWLLRARALLRLDPALRPDALDALACARAAAPWEAGPALTSLEGCPPEQARSLVDRLLATGFLPDPWRLMTPDQPPALRQQLQKIADALPGLDLHDPWTAFRWVEELHQGELPLASLLLRVTVAGEIHDGCDLVERPELEEALRACRRGPGQVELAGAVWWLLRAERNEFARPWGPSQAAERARSERDARARALERACRAVYRAAPAGAPDLPDPLRLRPEGFRPGWRAPLPEEEALIDQPRDQAMAAWWFRLHRAEQAVVVRARAWAHLRPDPPPLPLSASDLTDPWGTSWALLRDPQDPSADLITELLEAGLPGEARLALERRAASRRSESPAGGYLNLLHGDVRWRGRDQPGREVWLAWALAVVTTPQVEAWDPPAFRAMAADLHLDLAGRAAAPERRAEHLREAWARFEQLPPGEVYWESPVDSAWRRVRLYALSGADPAALREAAADLRRACQDPDGDAGGLGRVAWWLSTEPEPSKAALEAIPELRALVDQVPLRPR